MELERIGKYRIVGKIGHGAMGEVYKAQDTVLNRFVALKRISPSLLADESFKKRFHREAQSAAQLNHPHIVTVFEFNEEKGQTYLVMEFLEGNDLKEIIFRRALNRLEDKLWVIEQICDGLAFAHGKGVVHRDLKPANIRVLPNLSVKIMDFGLARLGASELTRTGTVMGTPNYMSPEQVRGEKVDERSDLFSLGAILYELLSGRKAFDSESAHSILYEVLEHEPQPLRSWVPDVPPLLLPIVERCLAKDRDRRYASADHLREAIRGARRAIAAGKAAAALLQPESVDATPTIAGLESPTIAELSSPGSGSLTSVERPIIEGATALDLSASGIDRSQPRTARPEPTLRPLAPSPWRGVLLGLVILIAVAGLAVAWLRLGTPAAPAVPAAELAKEQEGLLREQLVASQVELARSYLESKEYADAREQAERVLALAPDNAEARDVLARAKQTLASLDASAREARALLEKGDSEGAARALGRVLAIDPRHPMAGELTAALDRQFRSQAEEARRAASRARGEAEKARASGNEPFRAAERAQREAAGLTKKQQYAQATQKFLEAGDGYDRARHASELATASEKAAAAAAASRAAAAPAIPSPSTSTAAATLPPPSALASSLAPPTLPPVSTVTLGAVDPKSALRRAVADFQRALDTKDLALYKSLRPGLSNDEEKRLRESWKAVGSQKVGITIDDLQVDGASATVRISRQDTIDGRAMPTRQQTIRFVQRDGSWTIQSFGQ
jgi:serine/threonine-protein kinase